MGTTAQLPYVDSTCVSMMSINCPNTADLRDALWASKMTAMVENSSYISWMLYITLGLLPLALVFSLSTSTDIVLLCSLILFRNRREILRKILSCNLASISSILSIVAGVSIILVATQVANWLKSPKTKIELIDESPRPLFFPSRTNHTRLFPKNHAFSYSYLLVGIPVGWRGSRGGMLSADYSSHFAKNALQDGSLNSTWYTVDAADYLERGYRHLGLDAKLRRFMESQGINHEDYPYAYLITAPKFLGYSFNPVSFWYLYSADKKLSAMILEVNNTFDERHPYFLKPPENSPEEIDTSTGEKPNLETHSTEKSCTGLGVDTGILKKRIKFTTSWAKEFHVSPFNSRKGTYSLIAYDPLYPSMSGEGHIDNTVTLISSKVHSKLVARIFSEGAPVDPQTMNIIHKIRFLLSWWWVGLVTYPRIVREAGKLFFRRKLHVWFRPEPLKSSISRHADATEQVLEAIFRRYLRHLVKSANSPLVVRYMAAGISDVSEEMMVSDARPESDSESRILEFKVLTPVFYSRFVHYAHDLEAFHSEFSESGTIWLSQPSLLPALVLKRPPPLYSIPGLVNYVSFKAIQVLRRRPAAIEGSNSTMQDPAHASRGRKIDIRTFRLAAIDGYILSESSLGEQRKYQTEVFKLFISDRIALGNVSILHAELFVVKFLIAWALAGSLFAS